MYGVALPECLAYLGIRPRRREFGWLDLPSFTQGELELLATHQRRSVSELAGMNSTVWAATRPGEHAFCPHCLAEDQRCGVPMFWRRGWLDAFAAWCPVHDRPLRSVATAALASTPTCEEAAALLVGKEECAAPLARAHLARRAGELHAAVIGEWDAQSMYERYGLRLPVQLRAVAVDVLDVLLRTSPGDPRDPPLFRLAEVLGIAFESRDYRVRVAFARTRLITQVGRLEARVMALAIVDALVAGRLDEGLPALASLQALRHPWLWHLLPRESVDALKEQARGWPPTYVREHWPELLDDRYRAMVRCAKISAGSATAAAVSQHRSDASRRYWRTVAHHQGFDNRRPGGAADRRPDDEPLHALRASALARERRVSPSLRESMFADHKC
jgi:hypothetical protein